MIDPRSFYHHLPTLTTRRLVLRKLQPDDAGAYFAFAGDPLVTRHLRWGPHGSIADTEVYLASVMADYANGQDSPWGIELSGERALVGAIHLMAIDPEHRKAEVGAVVARSRWGQGIGPEALQSVLGLCFCELGLTRVEGLAVSGNYQGQRMMEKCGMRCVRTLRDYAVQKGRMTSFTLYAVLADEFCG